VEGNDIRPAHGAGSEPAIHVSANRVNEAFPCRNVSIVNNTVSGCGILINGSPGENNMIRGNKAVGPGPLVILNQAGAKVEGNEGFTVDETPWMSADERRKAKTPKK
jgi:hypothetical protein